MEIIFILARIILGGYYLQNAVNHFKNTNFLAQYASMKKVPAPKLSVIIAGILLFIGGLSILFGIYIEFGILALTLFFLPVTFLMHNFWKETDPEKKMIEMVNFTKNLALWSNSLMILMIPQPWPLSLTF